MAWYNAGLSSNSGGASSFNELDDVSINTQTLSNGQVPIYNSSTHKWENGEQSSGSSGHTIVDDDGASLTQRTNLRFLGTYSEDNSTDDTTEVNVVREMTKAEFDLLSADEKTGFINITDITGGNDDRFQPVIYSEEEREIGVWTDGKPLYEKTIDFGALPNSETKTVNHNISDIETVCGIEGIAYSSSTNTTINLPFANTNNSNVVVISANRTSITVNTYRDRTSFNGYVTLQYTKTTDTAGSGQWTPQGVPAHHYSEDEQVVGTWIDGSTIYEKTIYVPTLSISSSGTVNQTIEANFVGNNLISVSGYKTSSEASTIYSIPDGRLRVFIDDQANLKLEAINNGSWTGSAYVTIRYTKSST